MTETSSGFWAHFEHQADIGVRGVGDTLAEAFAQAAIALCAIITDPDRVQPRQAITIHCEEPDRELLLVDWLNALIFEIASRRMLFSRFDITVEDGQLSAMAWGEPVDVPRHRPAVEVKGATYTELRVYRDDHGRWVAQCVVDV